MFVGRIHREDVSLAAESPRGTVCTGYLPRGMGAMFKSAEILYITGDYGIAVESRRHDTSLWHPMVSAIPHLTSHLR